MAVGYGDVVAGRRARLSREAQDQRKVFEGTYDVALQVIELRGNHCLTQAQLAQLCNMDQGDISRVERGATSPTLRTLGRIADALGADVRLVARAGSSKSVNSRRRPSRNQQTDGRRTP